MPDSAMKRKGLDSFSAETPSATEPDDQKDAFTAAASRKSLYCS